MRNFIKLLAAAMLLVGNATYAQKIKVACVGNSVTYGQNIPDREHNSYPAQLQRMLGDGYDVRNFGRSSATLNHHSEMSYRGLPQFREAMDFKADLVVIHLGLNDTDPRWWPNYSEEFIPDYHALIDSFRVANPKAKIWICLMTPIGHQHRRFQSGTRDWHEQEQQAIRQVAATYDVGLIDLFTPLYNRPDLFPDALHPDAEGARILATTVRQNITGNFGGIHMSPLYTDNMVLQRDRQLTIEGIANAGDKVTVALSAQGAKGKNLSLKAIAGANGKWQTAMPAHAASGPYTMEISTKSQKLIYNNVWFGDVWLCSGQSNMEFQLQHCTTAKADLAAAPQQKNIHIYSQLTTIPTSAIKWPADKLEAVNNLNYLSPTTWQSFTPDNARQFSAVAYHFGKMLADSLQDVHIGLICNPVGGTPLEGWVDRWTLQYEYPQILYDWKNNDHIQDWVRGRGSYNITDATNPLQRHPYEPCYMFECAIAPLGHAALKGTIWYQGESNAHNTELHERLFPLLLKSWRQWFRNEEMPFYFVQLSSLNRPSWPRFRNSQRLMARNLDNVWMAVSTDLGDSLDVHPHRKMEVGQRLALQALAHTYGHSPIQSQGPEAETMQVSGKTLTVSFSSARELKAANGNDIIGFEIAGPDGIYHPATARPVGTTIQLTSKKVSNPVAVRYAWQAFTRANLVNEAQLPASTFQLSLPLEF